MEQLPVPRLVK